MKYYVETKFYDSGKTKGRMYLESEAYDIDKTPFTECEGYDRYIVAFKDYDEAAAFLKDLEKA